MSPTQDFLDAVPIGCSWAVQDAENLVCFRLHFLAIQADGPNQFCIVAIEVGLNTVNERHAAASPIPSSTGHVLSKLAFAVDNYQPAIGKL